MMKKQIFKQLSIGVFAAFLFISCGEKDVKPKLGETQGEITATLIFSNGETTNVAFIQKKDDVIRPYLYGPNGNDHYKLWLRGEQELGNKVYTISIYVTMPEKGVGDYSFGQAWQYQDEGFVSEIHVGVTEKDNPLNLKQYSSFDSDNKDSKGIIVNSLTKNHIKGDFSGMAVYAGSDIVTIVNGEFDTAINRGDWPD